MSDFHKTLFFCLILSSVMILTSCSRNKELMYTEIGKYEDCIEELSYSSDFMPILDNFDEVESLQFYCSSYGGNINTVTLIVQYNSEDYLRAKEDVLKDYYFLDSPIYDKYRVLIQEHEFEYKGYTIKVVDDEKFYYPEHFGMLGYSDTKNQIVYLYHSDRSVNRIGNTLGDRRMSEFLDWYFYFGIEDNG
jgi:hypothetical protein